MSLPLESPELESLLKSSVGSCRSHSGEHIEFFKDTVASLLIEKVDHAVTSDIIRVSSSGKTMIAKILSPEYRVSVVDNSLGTGRFHSERDSLIQRSLLSPGCVPHLYGFSQQDSILFMEDLSQWTLLQDELMACRVDVVAVQRLAENLGRIHHGSHVCTLTEEKFSQMKTDCNDGSVTKVIQKYMFLKPFDLDDPCLQMKPEVEEVARKMLSNESFRVEVEHYRLLHLSKQECLVHGDLQTAAVMVKQGSAKIIHGGFSHIGPAALDLGTLLSNYMIAYHGHMLTEEDNDQHRQISYKMVDACHKTVHYYLENMKACVGDRQQYVANLMSETAGFAAIDMIRRTLGAVRAREITDCGSKELEVINSGIRLLRASRRIHSIDTLLNIALMLTF